MKQVWQYSDATGVERLGAMRGFSDFGGSDITYRFDRIEDGKLSGRLDCVSGARLQAARNVTAANLELAKSL